MNRQFRHQHRQALQQHKPKLFEGLRADDLKDMVSNHFRIDQYKSKMGNDDHIIVVSFKVMDKFPAIDLMEFIEKGYVEALDADMSSGEESDGKYSVFVEYQRDKTFTKHISQLIKDISKLCNIDQWFFKYFKDPETHSFTKEAIEKFVPLTPEDYKLRVKEHTIDSIDDVLDQGTTKVVDVDENNNFIITRPYSGNLEFTLENIGSYDELIADLPGHIQLDESSNSEVLFLEKYLGNYEIYKINEKFLIKNKDRAIIVSKKGW
jgi:hypothetical protein